MAKKLIAVGVIGNWTGPWHSAQRSEYGAAAGPIAPGERIRLEIEVEEGSPVHYDLGPVPISFRSDAWKRYRVIKSCASAAAPVPTTVEVLLANGSPSAQNHADHSKRSDTQ